MSLVLTDKRVGWNVRPSIVCKDGFTMSVQASRFHWCSPREDEAELYTHVEVGFPSQEEETLAPYAHGEDVFGYVPVDIVWAIIVKHGGVAEQLEGGDV